MEHEQLITEYSGRIKKIKELKEELKATQVEYNALPESEKVSTEVKEPGQPKVFSFQDEISISKGYWCWWGKTSPITAAATMVAFLSFMASIFLALSNKPAWCLATLGLVLLSLVTMYCLETRPINQDDLKKFIEKEKQKIRKQNQIPTPKIVLHPLAEKLNDIRGEIWRYERELELAIFDSVRNLFQTKPAELLRSATDPDHVSDHLLRPAGVGEEPPEQLLQSSTQP